jgi:hypothetical protein
MSDLNVYTTAEINALTPITGDLVLDSTLNAVKLYNGSAWKTFDGDLVAFENRWGASFDGSNDYLDLGSTFQSTYQSSHTISFWFKLDNTSSLQSLFGAWSGPASQNAIYFDGSANIAHRYRVATSPKATTNASFTADTNWHHYAVTLTQNGSNLDVKTYIDGVYKSTTSTAITMSGFSQSLNSYIGFRNGSTGYLEGKMNEVAILNTALSADDITKIYNGTAPNGKPTDLTLAASYDTDRTSNLKGYWRMGDDSSDSPVDAGSITGITDSSGNGNDATTNATSQPTFSDLTGETIYS